MTAHIDKLEDCMALIDGHIVLTLPERSTLKFGWKTGMEDATNGSEEAFSREVEEGVS